MTRNGSLVEVAELVEVLNDAERLDERFRVVQHRFLS